MKKNIILLLTTVLFLGGCADFLNMPPKNIKVVYTMVDVKDAMTGLLFATTNSNYYSGYSNKTVRFNGEDVMYPFTRNVNIAMDLYTNDIDLIKFIDQDVDRNRGGIPFQKYFTENKSWEGYKIASEIWGLVFTNVGYINMVMKDLENVPDYNKTDYERISGEARVMRAYYLLRLNALFAPYDLNDYGIPFNFDADVVEGGKRWKQTELYRKLIGEIMDVLNYETVPKESWNIFFNKRIMYAILAQTYQYKAESCAKEADDWAKAEYYAKEARAGGGIENTIESQAEVSTVPLNIVVNKPHAHALLRFSLYFYWAYSSSPWGLDDPLQCPTEDLYNLYDENDIRRSVYFKDKENRPYLVKFLRTEAHDATVTHVLFRYSDLMLIEAEALARQGKDGALKLLNEFKADKIPGYTGYTGNDVIGEILKERRKEFILEEQMNWLDMKRTGQKVTRQAKDEATGEIKTFTLESNDYRYTLPLPADTELMYNNVPQNPGWK